jgi:hypothetical protein
MICESCTLGRTNFFGEAVQEVDPLLLPTSWFKLEFTESRALLAHSSFSLTDILTGVTSYRNEVVSQLVRIHCDFFRIPKLLCQAQGLQVDLIFLFEGISEQAPLSEPLDLGGGHIVAE